MPQKPKQFDTRAHFLVSLAQKEKLALYCEVNGISTGEFFRSLIDQIPDKDSPLSKVQKLRAALTEVTLKVEALREK